MSKSKLQLPGSNAPRSVFDGLHGVFAGFQQNRLRRVASTATIGATEGGSLKLGPRTSLIIAGCPPRHALTRTGRSISALLGQRACWEARCHQNNFDSCLTCLSVSVTDGVVMIPNARISLFSCSPAVIVEREQATRERLDEMLK